jgi:N-methylhydantoinase A
MSGTDQETVAARAGRVGVEIGGTFTDMVWIGPDGRLRTGKTPSTPKAIHEAVLRVIDEADLALDRIEQVAHGSTVATNALITRRGAKAALVTTSGFRDALVIGRADRDHDIYSMRYRHPEPPIRRGMIKEVEERILHDGTVLHPLDREAAWRAILPLVEDGVEGIAICLLHAYRNPVHEKVLVELLRERAPGVAVSASHAVSPEFREYERSVTTAVNAFVGPVVGRYVGELSDGLSRRGYAGVMQIMQSNGGMMPASAADLNAVRMLLSGPAAGIRAALWFAKRSGIQDAITLDMGGTSTDVAIAPGLVPGMVPELKIDGLPVRTASVDMATIGAGGGSIAEIDRGGFLTVGPKSAGALPGPACYGRGGTGATVTDAQVIAGLLRPTRFFGGRMVLRDDLARAALGELNFPGGVREAADAVLRMVNSNMASAVRLVSARRGIDPSAYTIVAFGGGGPLHGAMVAEELGMRQVLVPWAPGLSSAFGLLIADTLIDFGLSDIHPLGDGSLDRERIRGLKARAAEAAAQNGLEQGSYSVSIGLDMRYAGQAFELTVWTEGRPTSPADLRRLFEDEHRIRYGYARRTLSVEVVGYRIRVADANDAKIETPLPSDDGPAPETVFLTMSGREIPATLVLREAMRVGARLDGPAIVAEATSTTFVPPEWEAEVLPSGDLMLRRRP